MEKLTLERAKALKHGEILLLKNTSGKPLSRWRVSGKVKTWKRDPTRIYVPLKHGLYDYGHLDEFNIGLFFLATTDHEIAGRL